MLHAAVGSVGWAVWACQRPCRVTVLQCRSDRSSLEVLVPPVARWDAVSLVCDCCVIRSIVACSAACPVCCLASSLQASAVGSCVCGRVWGWLAGPYSLCPGGNKPSQVSGAAAVMFKSRYEAVTTNPHALQRLLGGSILCPGLMHMHWDPLVLSTRMHWPSGLCCVCACVYAVHVC
jgi:hypothetical protein